MRQAYQEINFKPDTLAFIRVMNSIIGEYQQAGYVLTVRQLYYQLVARDIIPNTLQEYKRAASIINDGKMAGLIDWDAIEDRTREFVSRSHWTSGAEILETCAKGYHQDLWVGQEYRVFVIVEKEALAGVLDRPCRELDVPLLAARGYPSGTVLREFAQEKLLPAFEQNQMPIILHLGDHDPSGIDMTRDLKDRLALFGEYNDADEVDLYRIALNMDQVEQEQPPENPAKKTDARFKAYRREFGDSSWELDALPPQYLDRLVRTHIEAFVNKEQRAKVQAEIEEVRVRIENMAAEFEERDDD
jgi:hypothetical protein